MGNKNSVKHNPLLEGVDGYSLVKRKDPQKEAEEKANRYMTSQGHVDLLFEMLSPHVPDSVANIIFLFELSLPREAHANEIRIKEREDLFSLDKEKLASLQFGDEIILLSAKCSRQWIYTYSQEKRQFILEE